MRVREHLLLSSVATCVVLPWLKQESWIPFAASILIDVDHYLWHVVKKRTLSLREAVRFFEQADPQQTQWTKFLHHPAMLGLLLFIAVRFRWRLLRLVVFGMLFHVSFDVLHVSQLYYLKKSLSQQAQSICPDCQQYAAKLQIHTLHTPANLLDRYNPKHFTVLCPTCHERAHL